MVLLQVLLAFLRRSLGKIFQAIFGWAVLAVFGHVGKREKALLSVVIGAAASWPILVLGVAFPRAVAFLVTLLPIPEGVSKEVVRAVWIVAALAIPLIVGATFGRRAGDRSRRLSWFRSLLLGFPATLALAGAFLIVCVSVPAGKLAARLSRKRQEEVVLITPPRRYHAVAAEIRDALAAGGLPVEPAAAAWHLRALSAILRTLGGEILGALVPSRLEFFRGSGLEVTLYPGSVSLLGPERAGARAHALIAARAPRTPALQTTSPEAQRVEAVIRKLWREHERGPKGRRDRELRDLFSMIAEVEADYEDWETLFRQGLQLTLELRGDANLLESAVRATTAPAPAEERAR